MLNTFLVVWRESFEALLILGILAAALRKNNCWQQGRTHLIYGCLGGVSLAALLAGALLYTQTELQGIALEHFQTAMLFVAAWLVLHMCLWMKKHSQEIFVKSNQSVQLSKETGAFYGIAVIACLAIGREGMETVLFLYGSTLEAIEQKNFGPLLMGACFGLVAAFVTSTIISKGLRFISYKWFFRISSGFLLLMAGGFVISGGMRLVQANVLPAIVERVWDTSQILNDASWFGKILSMLTGYVSAPSLIVVFMYCGFWALYCYLAQKPGAKTQQDKTIV